MFVFVQDCCLPATLLPFLPHTLNDLRQLLNGLGIPRHCMPLAMVKENCRVVIAHAEQCHSSMDIWIFASNNVARRYIDYILTFIRKDAINRVCGRGKP